LNFPSRKNAYIANARELKERRRPARTLLVRENMSPSNHVGSQPTEVVLTQEKWEQFGRDYRAELDFCRVLQTDFISASQIVCHSGLAAQSEARAMIRCFGSLIDGLTGSMRSIAIKTCKLFGRPLNPFLQEKTEERTITTYHRIQTSYRLIGEFLPRSPLAAATDELWDDLHSAIEIRNRVVHPKCAKDLEVTPTEALLVAEIGDEFCRHLNQFVQWLIQKEQKLVWEHVVERRRLYPKIGRNEKCPCGSGRKYKSYCAAAATAA
jgi:hypothetical protein